MSTRKSRPKPVTNEPGTLDELLAELSEHGLNFVLGEPLWDRLTAYGVELIPELLERTEGDNRFNLVDLALQKLLERSDADARARAARHLKESLGRTSSTPRRMAAIDALPHASEKDALAQDLLLNIAVDPTEPAKVRTSAFKALARMHPVGAQADRLLAVLELKQEQWLEHEGMCDAVFSCLGKHAPRLPGKRLLEGLEPFLTHASPRLRSGAIKLLGTCGDLDTAEGLLALPDAPLHHGEILDAISEIGKRPINLLSLRPEAFEVFLARLLRRMGHHKVSVGRYTRDDGVDATAYKTRENFAGEQEEKWIVQCKRYSERAIDEATIKQFAESLVEQRAHHGLFITTSSFTPTAVDFAKPRKNLELISGPQLLKRLKRLFGEDSEGGTDRYDIIVRK
jgi:hypothetical protein